MASNRKRVLHTDTMGQAGLALFRARDDIEAVPFPNLISAADYQKLLASFDQVNGVALGGTRFGKEEISRSKGLQVCARIGVGYDAVDVPALTAIKVPLMVAGTANSPSVAEQAVHFMMALAKRGVWFNDMVADGRWAADRMKRLPVDLYGKTLLVVGFGRIGTRTAKRCLAMEMNVQVYDPYVKPEVIRAAGCTPAPDLDAALATCDFLTIHCPKSPTSINLIDAPQLARMKPTAFLINTARGGIVNEKALHAALTSNKLSGAGLDVFEVEPTPKENALLKLPNVISAPHMAGVTAEAVERMAEATARNILSAIDGKPIRENVINQEIFA
jgi:D-3-phosphoglycerate dehydrogenase / 2-oxoglutarate reductase